MLNKLKESFPKYEWVGKNSNFYGTQDWYGLEIRIAIMVDWANWGSYFWYVEFIRGGIQVVLAENVDSSVSPSLVIYGVGEVLEGFSQAL